MPESENAAPVPVWKLERFLLQELPKEEMEKLRALPDLEAQLETVQAEWGRLRKALPPCPRPAPIVSTSRTLKIPEIFARPLWGNRAPALAGMALVLASLLFLPWMNFRTPSDEAESTRIKGVKTEIFLYRKNGSRAERLMNGDRVKAGDWIQAFYSSGGLKYGALFSVDGRGDTTWHLPSRPGSPESVLLDPHPHAPAPFSLELDSVPGEEAFHFFAAPEPFPLHAIGSAPTPELRHSTFRLIKE